MYCFRFINNLSLDLVAATCICSLFLARVLDQPLPPAVVLALALAVWAIYTADHLLDAWLIPHPASTERHAFHQRHFGVLCLLLAAMLVLALCLLPAILLF